MFSISWYRIIEENFNVHKEDENNLKKDRWFFGVGIYATDNMFYASMYYYENGSFHFVDRWWKW